MVEEFADGVDDGCGVTLLCNGITKFSSLRFRCVFVCFCVTVVVVLVCLLFVLDIWSFFFYFTCSSFWGVYVYK